MRARHPAVAAARIVGWPCAARENTDFVGTRKACLTGIQGLPATWWLSTRKMP